MRNKVAILCSIGSMICFIVSGQATIDCSNKESIQSSTEIIMESLDSLKKNEFRFALVTVIMSGCIDDQGSFYLNCAEKDGYTDSIYKILHGKTYPEVMTWAEEVQIIIDKKKLAHRFKMREIAAIYDKNARKFKFELINAKKHATFNSWLDIEFTYSNELDVDINNLYCLVKYESDNEVIEIRSSMNVKLGKGKSGKEKAFISNSDIEKIQSFDVEKFSLEIIAAKNYQLPKEEQVIFNRDYLTESDKELIERLEKTYPD